MLELKNLTFEVPLADGSKETKRIIDDLSLTIPDGRFTVITGPNGGGKSTLAKLIMGVERATSGQILLDGEDITDLSISERAKKGIGYGSVNHPVDRDPVCGFSGIIGDQCPGCGRHEDDVPFERIRRITGYLVGTLDRFNNAKRAEERDRVKHNV